VPHRPPQIPHDLNQARTRAAAVGSRRLITRAMELPEIVGIAGRLKECVFGLCFHDVAPSSLKDRVATRERSDV
jgi:hypothetical protein